MAKNKKPKYLEKETPELLTMLKDILTSEDPDTDKAAKIATELETRSAKPGVTNVDEALQAAADAMTEALNVVKAAYDAEVAMIGSDDDGEDDEEEEAPKGKGKGKKAAPIEETDDDEDDEDGDDDDGDDEDDYDSWSQKALKTELRKRGIRVKKDMDKTAMIKALRADDED